MDKDIAEIIQHFKKAADEARRFSDQMSSFEKVLTDFDKNRQSLEANLTLSINEERLKALDAVAKQLLDSTSHTTQLLDASVSQYQTALFKMRDSDEILRASSHEIEEMSTRLMPLVDMQAVLQKYQAETSKVETLLETVEKTEHLMEGLENNRTLHSVDEWKEGIERGLHEMASTLATVQRQVDEFGERSETADQALASMQGRMDAILQNMVSVDAVQKNLARILEIHDQIDSSRINKELEALVAALTAVGTTLTRNETLVQSQADQIQAAMEEYLRSVQSGLEKQKEFGDKIQRSLPDIKDSNAAMLQAFESLLNSNRNVDSIYRNVNLQAIEVEKYLRDLINDVLNHRERDQERRFFWNRQ